MKLRLLTYHQTSPQQTATDVHVLPQREFTAQVDILCASHVPVADAHCLSKTSFAYPYAVGLTFDDGASSDLANARYLHARGLNGMFFVSTARIGTPGFLARAQILEIRDMGMLIGSHSHEHRALDLMSIEAARQQMAASKAILEELLGREVDHLAFPGGGHNRHVLEAARGVGFRYAFTTIWGVNQMRAAAPTLLRRDMIVRGMSNERFRDLILGKHDLARQSTYWCKQVARGLLPNSIYGALRRKFIDG